MLNKLLRIKNYHPVLYKRFFFPGSAESSKSNDLNQALDWLLESQKVNKDGGYSHSFHIFYGWQSSYPETTGYIIPSLLDAYKITKRDELINSAFMATNWLKKIQNKDGSFNDLSGNKQVFDVGQILIGLNYVYENYPQWNVKDSLARAAEWLVSVQEEDGSFKKFAYNNEAHSYYSRVGAALIKSGILLNNNLIKESGLRKINWVLGQQRSNGLFNRSSFKKGHHAYSHNLVYILEGLLDSYELTQSNEIKTAMIKYAEALKVISAKDAFAIPSCFNEDITPTKNEYCLTGVSQWAHSAYRIYELTNDHRFKHEALKNFKYVRSKQYVNNSKELNGGIPGSFPVNGEYLKYSIPNWGIKFFVDAYLALKKEIKEEEK